LKIPIKKVMKKILLLFLLSICGFLLNGCSMFGEKIPTADVNIGDRRGTPPLHHAIEKNNIEIVKMLIEKGADVDAVDSREKPAIVAAVENGNIEIIKILLEKNVKLNVIDKQKNTPLIIAVQNERNDIVELLLQKGAESE
jgi:ankyrin repeat protein